MSLVFGVFDSFTFLSFVFTSLVLASFVFTSLRSLTYLTSFALSLALSFVGDSNLSVDFALGVSLPFLTNTGVTGDAGLWTYLPDLIARMSVLDILITFLGVVDLFLFIGLGEGFLVTVFSTEA
jgi:hypothetical protein